LLVAHVQAGLKSALSFTFNPIVICKWKALWVFKKMWSMYVDCTICCSMFDVKRCWMFPYKLWLFKW
jgi:hypothetical protein